MLLHMFTGSVGVHDITTKYMDKGTIVLLHMFTGSVGVRDITTECMDNSVAPHVHGVRGGT